MSYVQAYEDGYHNGRETAKLRRKKGMDASYLEKVMQQAQLVARQGPEDQGWLTLANASGFAAGWRDGWGK